MPVPTPAMITYTPQGLGEQTIKFHAVISEQHEAASEITKFPVQTGFIISNNSIRKNRIINLVGIITNTPIAGHDKAYEYSSNNSKTIFEALEALVNSGQECEVVTNLGIYDPIVFTNFKTKQEKGMVDSMRFHLTGEEVQVSTTVSNTAPKELQFVVLTEAEADARRKLLRETGINVCEESEISEAEVSLFDSFKIASKDKFGKGISTVYEKVGYDPTSSSSLFSIHTDDTDLVTGTDPSLTGKLVSAGSTAMTKAAGCAGGSGLSVVEDFAKDTLTTASGELKKSAYGAYYDTVHMTENKYGQKLIKGGIGCIVRGVTGFESDTPWEPLESLPSPDQIIDGAKKLFKDPTGENAKKEVLTQVKCPDEIVKS